MQCHHAWNWRTEREEKGAIHNPHYFEWQQSQRRNGRADRNPMDVQCGGVPRHWPYCLDWNPNTATIFNRILRVAIHIRAHQIDGHLPVRPDTLPTRVKYLEGGVDEKMWGSLLYKAHQQYVRRMEFFNIHQMFDAAITDIILRTVSVIRQRQWTPTREIELLTEYNALRKYYNGELFRYCRRFGGRGKHTFEYIDDTWELLPGDNAPMAQRVAAEVDASK